MLEGVIGLELMEMKSGGEACFDRRVHLELEKLGRDGGARELLAPLEQGSDSEEARSSSRMDLDWELKGVAEHDADTRCLYTDRSWLIPPTALFLSLPPMGRRVMRMWCASRRGALVSRTGAS